MNANGRDPFWPIRDGFFVPWTGTEIVSDVGMRTARAVEGVGENVQVFLRGSALESPRPFVRADVDLIVIRGDHAELATLHAALPFGPDYDVKILHRDNLSAEFVQRALIFCRAVQLCGPKLMRTPVAADKEFAWRLWVHYCPALIPDAVDTLDSHALIHFKLLARSFGVLSFLRHRRFTRDVSACIAIAASESAPAGESLRSLRQALENRNAERFDVRACKGLLQARFDTYFDTW